MRFADLSRFAILSVLATASLSAQIKLSVYTGGSFGNGDITGTMSTVDQSNMQGCVHSAYQTCGGTDFQTNTGTTTCTPGETLDLVSSDNGQFGSWIIVGTAGANCSCSGNFAGGGPTSTVSSFGITGLQTYTSNASYVAFQPYPISPETPTQYLVIYVANLTPPADATQVCVDPVCGAYNSAFSVNGFTLGVGWSVTDGPSGQINIPYWLSSTAVTGDHTLTVQTQAGTSASYGFTVAPATNQVTRPTLTQATSTGTPNYMNIGTYMWSASGVNVAYATGQTTTTSPNTATLSNPPNPAGNGAPTAGSLAVISSWYQPPVPVGAGISNTFHVPVFGMSCYYTTTQQQWGTAPNNCGTTTVYGVYYSGSQAGPPGSPTGTYCSAFLAQLRLQGSAVLANGQNAQYNPPTASAPAGTYSTPSHINGSDNTAVIAWQTVARDRNVIPTRNSQLDLNGVGTNLTANDTGNAIVGYRVDIYGGAGPNVCSGYSNIMSIGGCNPSSTQCPGDTVVQ